LTVGLYIAPELLSLNLRPVQLLIAAEIMQFGEGKCHAQCAHFECRFGLSRNTVLDAIKHLKKIGILTQNKTIMTIRVSEPDPEIGTICSESDPVSGSEIDESIPEIDAECQKLDLDLNIEDKKEDNKKTTMRSPRKKVTKDKVAKVSKQNPWFDAVALVTNLDSKLNGSGIGKISNQLKEAGYEPEDILHIPNILDMSFWSGKIKLGTILNKCKDAREDRLGIASQQFNSLTHGESSAATEPPPWPGTDADRRNPYFKPGLGWRLERYERFFPLNDGTRAIMLPTDEIVGERFKRVSHEWKWGR
jgi:hypothetical protein